MLRLGEGERLLRLRGERDRLRLGERDRFRLGDRDLLLRGDLLRGLLLTGGDRRRKGERDLLRSLGGVLRHCLGASRRRGDLNLRPRGGEERGSLGRGAGFFI